MTVAAAIWCGILAGAGMLLRSAGGRRPDARRLRRVDRLLGLGVRCRRAASRLARRGRPAGDGRAASPPSGVVLRLVDDLATQVRAGASPAAAWSVATDLLGRAADGDAQLTRPGESPRDCLDRLATAPGAAPQLLALSAAWALCEDVGAPLADVLRSVADAIRADAEIDADIESALAAPRSTARLLAFLPLAGLLLGQLIGARPVHVLLDTPAGRSCGLAGLVLALVGRWSAGRLVERTAALL